VFLTHLHLDHAGGVVSLDAQGQLIPTFPNAILTVCRQEYEDAVNARGITPNAYQLRGWQFLEEHGQLRLIELNNHGDCPHSFPVRTGLAPALQTDKRNLPAWIQYIPTPGHTDGHQSILITGQQRSLLFTGDLLPLRRHAVPYFNMAYDVTPVVKSHTKQLILERAARENWLLVLCHEPKMPIYRPVFCEHKGWYELEEPDLRGLMME
jgi:glyoxylase-like metal-dependent hydrolase (beta-lactamase superfamily II)